MSRFAPKTLRRMPPATREIARLANELASVQTRLANRIAGLVSTEMMARASERVFCSNAALAGEAVDALARLRRSVEPFDPDRLFGEPGPEPQRIELS